MYLPLKLPQNPEQRPGYMPVLLPMKSHAAPVGVGTMVQSFLSTKMGLFVLAAFLISLGAASYAQAASGAQLGTIALLWKWTPLLAKGFGFNVLISILSMAIGTVLGVCLGILQVSPNGIIRRVAWLVTQFFRNSPWLVLLFYCILLIPFEIEVFGTTIPFPGWLKAVIGLSLPVMAYMSEYMRGAIQSLPSGQWESADSLGFSRGQTMRMVILPQTVKRLLPPWMNLYAVLTMATPLVSIVGVDEIMSFARAALASENRVDLLIPMYLYVLCWFFIYCFPISGLTRRLENRFAVKS
ncbi:amino acid ABC transporter permease [Cognatishimia activa]|uniref:Inner membrane amino-acid ABC transporter permease protein YecS n=1 Tax=Cognatishimia activa TaxID=1715691 RepID=A0A0P1IUL2_9RHOB|nr:amino acid ABC transporter permease [Cognatishimia activa]CUI32591.1 Inner membrane amino-acid ABC transporter permease protein YecS [Cognatishimia activa]CUK24804.1 Inner membrane amino-acid ABC transporter permease protein YecS [Cognatishimia activa]